MYGIVYDNNFFREEIYCVFFALNIFSPELSKKGSSVETNNYDSRAVLIGHCRIAFSVSMTR